MNPSDDCDPRGAMLALRQALDGQDLRAVDRQARHLRRLYDACRDGWDDHRARDVGNLLDEADRALGWCVGFKLECPEVRSLLDTIANEGCSVHLGGGVVQLRSRDDASRIAQRAAGKLADHFRGHELEVWWMVTGRLPGEQRGGR